MTLSPSKTYNGHHMESIYDIQAMCADSFSIVWQHSKYTHKYDVNETYHLSYLIPWLSLVGPRSFILSLLLNM